MRVRHQRTEAQVIHACDRAVEAAGGSVTRFVPGRRDGQQSVGVPRRRYHWGSVAWWWSPRSDKGVLSSAVRSFLIAEYSCGQIVGAGDDDGVRLLLNACRRGASHEELRMVAWASAATVASRGTIE